MTEGRSGKDWLRRNAPVDSSLVPAFSVTCRTLRHRRNAAHEEDRMHRLEHNGRRVFAKGGCAKGASARAVAAASAVVVSSLALAGAVAPGMAFAARSAPARPAAAAADPASACQLGNGVKHVIQI